MDELAPGATPALDADEARWAAAQSVLDRTPTATARQRLRRYKLLLWSLVVGVGLVVPAVVMLLLVLLDAGAFAEDDGSSGWLVAGSVVQVAGLLALVGYLVVGRRAGLFRGAWSQPTAVLDRSQRRSLLAAVRGRGPVDSRRLPLARHLAERLVLQRHQVLLFVGLTLQQVGRAIASPDVWNLVLTAVLVAAYLVALPLLARDARRADRFLQAYPAPSV